MTPLEKILRDMIAAEGPMAIDRYMSLCLGHPVHGYYMTRDPFGQAGDFTTAPEITQVFGELIGVWCASIWQMMGAPRRFALVELGPGRGTLMADMLRVLSKSPECAKAAQVHFVETSPVLREAQMQRVPQAIWHDGVASLAALPSIIIANEFFDALPIRQFERRSSAVAERCIGLENDALAVGLVPSAFAIPVRGEGVYEDGSVRNAIATHLGHHLATLGGAALVIDYGHLQSALGDTLQAIKNHAPCSIVDEPGATDITAHVDFAALAKGFAAGGAKIAGAMTQGEFLTSMGIEARTEVLAKAVSGEKRSALVAATQRLARGDEMGQLFKVMAVTARGLPVPYPFGAT